MVNAVYTLNRCPTRALRSVIPKETWNGKKLYVAHMHVFRSLTYAMVTDEKRCSLDRRGIKCMFLDITKV